MADGGPSNSPAFNPPMNRITDNDPSIIRVPLDQVGMGFRKSQQSGLMTSSPGTGPISHIKNGS